jgi:hypothetical protein
LLGSKNLSRVYYNITLDVLHASETLTIDWYVRFTIHISYTAWNQIKYLIVRYNCYTAKIVYSEDITVQLFVIEHLYKVLMVQMIDKTCKQFILLDSINILGTISNNNFVTYGDFNYG